jgi:hypothetical protein
MPPQSESESQMSGTGLSLSDAAENIISELNVVYGTAHQKVGELIETLRTSDNLDDEQIKKVLLDRVKFISRTQLYEYMPPELKREYKPKSIPPAAVKKPKVIVPFYEEAKPEDPEDSFIKSWDDVGIETESEIDRQIAKADEGPVTVVDMKPKVKDQDAEMEALAQKHETKTTDSEDNDMNLAEPIRIVTFSKPEEARNVVMAYIMKLKARGWKVVELQARFVS